MSLLQGDIVLLPFSFSDMEGSKVRPAIIVSNSGFNETSPDCIMVPITSVIKGDTFSILLNQEDLSAGELLKKSRIKADKIFCVEKGLVMMKIGSVNEKKFAEIKSMVLSVF